MYKSIKQLKHYELLTSDGKDCELEDLFFDENTWKTKYLVVKTGSWLMGRRVLVKPSIIQEVNHKEKQIKLPMPNDKVKESPAVDSVLPISLEAELLLAKYWEWVPKDAEGPLPEEAGGSIEAEATTETKDLSERAVKSKLRSFDEVAGYKIHAPDGVFGHLEDFLCDDDWIIRYAVVDPRSWFPGKHVLLPVCEIEDVKWSEHALHVEASRELVKSAPAYIKNKELTPEDEKALRQHFS